MFINKENTNLQNELSIVFYLMEMRLTSYSLYVFFILYTVIHVDML